MRAIAVLCLSGALLTAQPQTPARDATRVQRRLGTGAIRGRVVAADTGAPIRRATVSISSEGQPPAGATVLTDAGGRFAVEKLPAGTYRISARPSRYHAQYLPRPLGNIAAAGAPVTVTLAEGQVVDRLDIALSRAGAIVGHAVDENGDPVSDVAITSVRAPGTPLVGTTERYARTDDRGRFRLYGLTPGEYYVVAKGDQSEERIPGQESLALVQTYAPGTSSRDEAARVRVLAGQDAAIDIQVLRGRTFRIAGILLDARGQPATHGVVTLSEYQSARSMSSSGLGVDQQGRFQFDAKLPGSYRISGKILDDVNAPVEYVKMPVTITDADVTGIVLAARPAVGLTGQLVFADGAPASLPTEMWVRAIAPDPTLAPEEPQQARVRPDLTFTLMRLFGDTNLQPNIRPFEWHLKAVFRGNEDITDTPVEFRAEDSGRVQIVVSSRMSRVEGRLVDTQKSELQGNIVLLFGDDRATWRSTSNRFKWSGTDRTGHFALHGLRPGRYYIIALPRDRAEDLGFRDAGPPMFEGLVREATSILVGEDEARSVDLKLATGGQ